MARYPFPWDLFLALSRDLLGGQRSLTADAALMAARIDPPPRVAGREHIPCRGPLVLAVNHYQRRGLWIGWPGAVITLAVAERRHQEPPVRWLATGGLRLFQAWNRGPEVPLSGLIFREVARIYGMSALPLSGSAARAHAVRRWARQAREGWALGLFPEGLGGRSAGLQPPAPGFGLLCRLLAPVPIEPVGISEANGILHIAFGPPLAPGASPDAVMGAIAALLPPDQRGPYRVGG